MSADKSPFLLERIKVGQTSYALRGKDREKVTITDIADIKNGHIKATTSDGTEHKFRIASVHFGERTSNEFIAKIIYEPTSSR